MAVRQSLNRQNPKVIFGATAGIVVIVAGLLILWMRGGGTGSGANAADVANRAFFSTDDGKTWFIDDASKLAPFQKDGKEAIRAYVYKCADGKEFVGFLERYTPAEKKRREAAAAAQAKEARPVPMLDSASGIEVKAPGQAAWIRQSDKGAPSIMMPKCPGGGSAEMVLP